MQSSAFTRSVTGNTILFKNNLPLENVQSIKFYTDKTTGSFSKKEFRWSFSGDYWSAWTVLNQGNFSAIQVNNNQYLYLEIRYVAISILSDNATSFIVNYSVTSGTTETTPVIPTTAECIPDSTCVNNEAGKLYEILHITNADTLDNKHGDYYLLRSNQTGQQSISTITNLQTTLNALYNLLNINAINVDGSGIGVYYGLDGSSLAFKKIYGGNKIIISEIDGVITIDTDNLATDASITDLYNQLILIESSISNISNYQLVQDASILSISSYQLIQDASIQWLLDNTWKTTDLFVRESSLGSQFYWNTGLLEVSILFPAGITDISTSHVWYDTALDPCLAMPSAVGGIPAGTTAYDLYGDNVTSILNDLLFPTVQPTLTAPSGTFIMTPSTTLYEVSTYIATLNFATALNQGSIYNGATYQNVRSGSCNNYNFTGSLLVDVSSNISPNSQDISIYVTQVAQSWSCQISYDQGPQPLDNKGNNAIVGPLVAGTLTASSTRTITGAYPLYATTVGITTLTKQTLVVMTTSPAPSTSGMLLVAETGGDKQKFEIPVAWPYTDLTGIETYNTVSAQWEYELGSNTLSLTRWTVTDSSESIQSYNTLYKRYTYNGPDRSAATIRLVI